MKRLLLAFVMLTVGCTREEGAFQLVGNGFEVKEVRPGLTCVFVNGVDGGVSCVAGSFPKEGE